MQNRVPHDVLTISEMTRKKSRTVSEIYEVNKLILTDDLIRKLRASSSMCNKSTYIQLMYDGTRYNIERVAKARDGQYRICLISPTATAVLTGKEGSGVEVIGTYRF